MLFFVLSGFLITYLLLWENKHKGKINLPNYLLRRFLRVWPLYFLIVLFGFFLFPKLPYGVETVHEFWRYAMFLSNIDEIYLGLKDSLNFLTATWTVSVEEQFYITWGILIGLFSFRKKATYLIFFSAIIVLSLIFRYYNLHDDRILYYHTFSVMSELAFGGIIGYLAFEGSIIKWFKLMKRWQILLGYAIIALLFTFDTYIFKGPLFVFERFVPGLAFSFMIMEQVFAERSLIKIDKVPYFFKSGELTYGFYMFHCLYMYYWSIFFANNGWTDSIWYFVLYILVNFASTCLTAYLSYHYFERPFLNLKRLFR